MHITATMLARNEGWIIGLSARSALMWCDSLVILDHSSVDDTSKIITEVAAEYPGRVYLLREEDPVWFEMKYRHRMLEAARSAGASHICVVDADEILSGNFLSDIRPMIESLRSRQSLEPPWACLRGSINRYHSNGIWGTNWVSMAFRDLPHLFWKDRGGYDFHHRRPMGDHMTFVRPWKQGDGGLMHLQFVNDRRLRAKQACYKMQEVLRWPGREPVAVVDERYNLAVYGTKGDTLSYVPTDWWSPYERWLKYLDIDAAPWQEAQCRLWMEQYGADKFRGLDLFGVV